MTKIIFTGVIDVSCCIKCDSSAYTANVTTFHTRKAALWDGA